jgi:hypothetical protein
MQRQSNKEIGVRPHIAERTAKFHVSSLLAKFRVRDRINLTLKAAVGLPATEVTPPDTLFGFPSMSLAMLEDVTAEPSTPTRCTTKLGGRRKFFDLISAPSAW